MLINPGQEGLFSPTGAAPGFVPAAPSQAPHTLTTSRGFCRPFGASFWPRQNGVNFAVFSRHADKVHLLLFEEGKETPLYEIALDPHLHRTGDVWHIFLHQLPHHLLYGYRVEGPNQPQAGHRFDATKVLLDPYARAVSGGHPWGKMVHGKKLPRLGRLVFDEFDWQGDVPPRTPLAQTIVYELHVRGFTRHPSSDVRHPGTFLGLCEKIPHLQSLGVTAVQLMPILEFDELDSSMKNPFTGEALRNYWGYSTLSFFAPKAAFAAEAGQQVREFKEMIKQFHRAGIEVILDVVYNHTCEGNERGPTLSFRGLDNSIYYMLDREGRYYNFSGCGNTFNCNHPVVRDLIIDSLTYLVTEMHVDGFRFDLAAILGRGSDGKVLEDPPLIRHIAEHPVLAGTKLFAEAWDAAGLSQLGKFPAWGRWAEFNGWFRDDMRRFVRGEPRLTDAVSKRICGSVDLYGDASKHPYHSINFVTCHDGFTLHDLVSYSHKHNEANGEHNKDGWNDNLSWNCEHEGPTDNAAVQALRQKQMRNVLTLLFISQGVPLMLHGDEFGRTQQGNNNAYCQDNDLSWVDWSLADKNAGLLRFARMMIALRKRRFALSREEFINRTSWHGNLPGQPDHSEQSRSIAFQLHGWHGQPDFYVISNARWQSQTFQLPHRAWRRLVDTNLVAPHDIVEEHEAIHLNPCDHYVVAPRSTVILVS